MSFKVYGGKIKRRGYPASVLVLWLDAEAVSQIA